MAKVSGVGDTTQRAFLAGEYERAATLLRAEPGNPECSIFLAQVELRRGDPRASLAATQHLDFSLLAAPQRARALAYRGAAFATLGNAELSRAGIAEAKRAAATDAAAQLEVAYNDAYVSWMLHDITKARAIIDRSIEWAASTDTLMYARFIMLRGWVLAAENRFVEQAAAMQEAIDVLEAAPQRDVGLLAWATFTLAALVRDIPFAQGLQTVSRLEPSLSWTRDLRLPHFQTVRAVAWSHALGGEYIAAFRKFNAAIALADSPVAKILAHLDKVETARFSQQNLTAQADLDEAGDLIDGYDWSDAIWEEARALIQAAEIMAPVDADRAARYLAMGSSLRERMARNAAYVHDERLSAHTDYADALIRLARSDRRVSRHRARRAYEIYEQAGYSWRAARCALLLHRLGEPGDWLTRAQEAIAAYPRSFVAEEIAHAAGERNPLDDLTQRQVEILELLRTGDTIEQIASLLDISANTVRVHITRIHRAFGVERRPQLLIEAARWLDVA